MTDLTKFLLARIAEDEELAKNCVGINDLARHINGASIPRWVRDGMTIVSDDERRIPRVGKTWAAEAAHIARWDPARVLAECEAKRGIIKLMRDGYNENDVEFWALQDALRFLALPYADHEDYRQEWKP